MVTGSISPSKPVIGREYQRGLASWYGPGFQGRRTASGESFNSWAMTAAHRSLPFGTTLRVVNVKNGRSVVVRVNDRGPFTGRRIIDLAKGAAQELGLTLVGTAYVSLHRLD
ncbi:septal ring lytic transglycosylase RlpA family protein [Microvirga alba]|uniref:Endolytic peptidoglycan transglycosylase RlpA n=1 Tax=Microvirga alba TaxID=2791025 RepID=A0A931FNX3_9HYPH|nr:septal ring lytic transglycosylase RlpA family protein [Microvirga alba]MBF9232807.1 septal ring lytic transglycosylase RlpA family protein [Microvirga alba]